MFPVLLMLGLWGDFQCQKAVSVKSIRKKKKKKKTSKAKINKSKQNQTNAKRGTVYKTEILRLHRALGSSLGKNYLICGH